MDLHVFYVVHVDLSGHVQRRAAREREQLDAGALGLNGRPQGQGCHHPSLNLAGHDASVGRGLAREGHRVHDRR